MIRILIGLAVALAFAGGAHAQTFPTKPVRIVVPYPPGAITDALPRILAEKLRKEWGQPVVVENRPGAGGRVGAGIVAKAPADGYTLVVGLLDNFVVAPYLFKNMTYDPLRDFVPITVMARQSFILVTRQGLPVENLADAVRLAKTQPGKLRSGSWGEGSLGHLSIEMFNAAAGIELQHIPYKGSVDAMMGMVGGDVDMMFAGYSSTRGQIEAGKIRVVARSSAQRLALTPEIPTVAESGYPGFEVQAWYGLFAPAGTPRPIVDQINRAVVKAMAEPDYLAQVGTFYAEAVGNTPDEYAALLTAEHAKWSALVRKLNLQLD